MAQEESENTAAERAIAQPTPRRNASLDILRIVAMAFIVLLHLVQNNIGLNSVKTDSQAISVNLFLPASSIACVAVIGVNLFFLLSGYFGIKAKPSKVFSLIFKVYILWIISTFLGMAFGTLHFGSFVEWFFFVGKAITKYWFIIVYILLCIASPFLNAFAEKLAQGGGRYFAVITVILFAAAGFIADIFYPYFGTGEGFLPVWSWVVYLYGRLLRLNQDKIKFRARTCFLLWLACTALNFAAIAVIFAVGGNGALAIHFYAYNNPLVLASAVFFFIAFMKLNVNSDGRGAKLLSAIAPHVLTVYLIHSNNPLVSPFRAFLINLSPYVWGKFALLLPNVLVLYILGIAVDYLYTYTIGKPVQKLCRLLERGVLFLYKKIIDRKN